MTRSNLGRRWIRWFVPLSFLTLCLGSSAVAKRLGDKAKLDPLLESLIKPLDRQGIDVVVGDTSGVDLFKSSPPRVARLSGMPAPDPGRDWKKTEWMKEFEMGSSGFVAGVKSSGQVARGETADRSQASFLSEWDKAAPDRRVFLSFTSKDTVHAQAVARVLEEEGYVTFVFLRVGDAKPTFDAAFVGRMYAEAGHRMVVDTKNARESKGVWLEARLAKGGGPLGGDFPSSPASPGAGSDDGRGPGGKKPPRAGVPGAGAVEPEANPEMEAFLRGVRGGWVVTENPSTRGKLFVHRSSSGGMLRDLVYLVKVEADGSWTVYRSRRGASGSEFGERVGSTKKPRSVSVGGCSCM